MTDRSALAAVVTGDGRDIDAIREAIDGAEAVIAIVAAPRRKGPHQAAEVAGVITRAMAECGPDRLLVTSPYPLVATQPRLPIAILHLLLAKAYADQAHMEKVVMDSGLRWSIVRLNRLLDKPTTGGVRLTTDLFDKPTGLTRADAASAVLDVLADEDAVGTAVNAAGPLRK